MKNILVILFCSVIVVQVQGQSCCSKPATAEFAMLGSDKSFVASHKEPLPFSFNSSKGKMIKIKTDGQDANAYEVKGTGKKVILLFHEWWGLNDYIKQQAEKMQADLGSEYSVIALDLYDGKVTNNADSAAKIMDGLVDRRAKGIIKGALETLEKDQSVATIGWCMGGGWSLQAAIMAKELAKACVMYYGMPEKEKEKIKQLKAPVLGIFATKDKWINKQVVEEFEKNMKGENKNLTVKWFEADHAFANPSNPHFEKAAGEQAYQLSLNFITEHLK